MPTRPHCTLPTFRRFLSGDATVCASNTPSSPPGPMLLLRLFFFVGDGMIDAILDADFIGDRFSLSTKSAMISMPNGQMQYKNCLRATMLYAPEIKNRTCNFYAVRHSNIGCCGLASSGLAQTERTARANLIPASRTDHPHAKL